MSRKIAYWVSTSFVAALMAVPGVLYLAGPPQVIEGFVRRFSATRGAVLVACVKL